ncbi:MAG: D-alanyl-D-alanine carboxypeptidase [Proteobacteria bacterium]|nr:D-alanyl-D-alanine carboxypeptidase [Pseudomonadota bacterium]
MLPTFLAALIAAAALIGPTSPASARIAEIVIDAQSGAVLHENDADHARQPASLTKMMTLYLLFEALDSGRLKLTTRLPVSAFAAAQARTKLELEEGDLISVRDVILGLVTQSANDAAVVAAEGLAGTEERFAQMMTQRARALGMSRTVYHNASGLPNPAQVTTARDQATLARALIRQFPHHYGYFSTQEFTYGKRTFANHNHWMEWYEGADGIKTGFTNAAGFNLAASAVRDNRRLIGVVLGGLKPISRDRQMARLLDRAFSGAPDATETQVAQAPRRGPAAQLAAAQPTPAPQQQSAKAARSIESLVAAATAAAVPVDESSWGIQIGAYARADAARQAAEKAARIAPRELNKATVAVAPSERRKGSSYAARLVGLSQNQARVACKLLAKKHHDCVMVSPSELRGALRLASN